jgi:predicted phage-related endonuclease
MDFMRTTINAARVTTYPNRESWLSGRRIGASDSAAIFGCGYQNQSALTVWDRLVNAREDDYETKRMRIGILMEPSLRAIFAEETGLPCIEIAPFTVWTHPEIDWLTATLDAATEDDEAGWCPVELKNVNGFLRDDWNGDGPLKFVVQSQHQLAVTGAKRGYLLGLIGGHEPLVKTIPRNDRFIETALLPTLEKFWQHVQSGTMPPVDESAATARLLARLWPDDDGREVLLPADLNDVANEWHAAKAAAKAAEEQITACENRIKEAIGEATIGRLPNGLAFSWKTQHRKAYEVKASSARVFRAMK